MNILNQQKQISPRSQNYLNINQQQHLNPSETTPHFNLQIDQSTKRKSKKQFLGFPRSRNLAQALNFQSSDQHFQTSHDFQSYIDQSDKIFQCQEELLQTYNPRDNREGVRINSQNQMSKRPYNESAEQNLLGVQYSSISFAQSGNTFKNSFSVTRNSLTKNAQELQDNLIQSEKGNSEENVSNISTRVATQPPKVSIVIGKNKINNILDSDQRKEKQLQMIVKREVEDFSFQRGAPIFSSSTQSVRSMQNDQSNIFISGEKQDYIDQATSEKKKRDIEVAQIIKSKSRKEKLKKQIFNERKSAFTPVSNLSSAALIQQEREQITESKKQIKLQENTISSNSIPTIIQTSNSNRNSNSTSPSIFPPSRISQRRSIGSSKNSTKTATQYRPWNTKLLRKLQNVLTYNAKMYKRSVNRINSSKLQTTSYRNLCASVIDANNNNCSGNLQIQNVNKTQIYTDSGKQSRNLFLPPKYPNPLKNSFSKTSTALQRAVNYPKKQEVFVTSVMNRQQSFSYRPKTPLQLKPSFSINGKQDLVNNQGRESQCRFVTSGMGIFLSLEQNQATKMCLEDQSSFKNSSFKEKRRTNSAVKSQKADNRILL